MKNKKTTIQLTITVLLFATAFVMILGRTQQQPTNIQTKEKDLESVSVRLPVPVYDACFTQFFTAVDQGYYESEGLDVTFNFGTSETNPVKMVTTGADEFGILGGPDTLLVARSKGQPVRAFALLHQYANFTVLVTPVDSGITTVYDLEGKKIGFNYGHISTDIIRNTLRQERIDHTEVDVGFDFSQLITGKVDAQFGFRTHAPMYLREKGVDVNIISPQDYGIVSHGYTIFATEEMLTNRPEIAENFWRATSRGIEFAKNNPEEAIKSITTRDPKLNYEVELEKLAMYNEVIGKPYGYMTEEMFQDTYDRLLVEDVIENEFDVQESMDLDVLEKVWATG